jgi:hypothetical protein
LRYGGTGIRLRCGGHFFRLRQALQVNGGGFDGREWREYEDKSRAAPEGAFILQWSTASLKRCPDTNLFVPQDVS